MTTHIFLLSLYLPLPLHLIHNVLNGWIIILPTSFLFSNRQMCSKISLRCTRSEETGWTVIKLAAVRKTVASQRTWRIHWKKTVSVITRWNPTDVLKYNQWAYLTFINTFQKVYFLRVTQTLGMEFLPVVLPASIERLEAQFSTIYCFSLKSKC